MKGLIDSLANQLKAGGWEEAKETAHAAKGAANMTGALELGAVCAEIDTALLAGDNERAQSSFPAVAQAFDRASAEIRAILDTPPG